MRPSAPTTPAHRSWLAHARVHPKHRSLRRSCSVRLTRTHSLSMKTAPRTRFPSDATTRVHNERRALWVEKPFQTSVGSAATRSHRLMSLLRASHPTPLCACTTLLSFVEPQHHRSHRSAPPLHVSVLPSQPWHQHQGSQSETTTSTPPLEPRAFPSCDERVPGRCSPARPTRCGESIS